VRYGTTPLCTNNRGQITPLLAEASGANCENAIHRTCSRFSTFSDSHASARTYNSAVPRREPRHIPRALLLGNHILTPNGKLLPKLVNSRVEKVAPNGHGVDAHPVAKQGPQPRLGPYHRPRLTTNLIAQWRLSTSSRSRFYSLSCSSYLLAKPTL
jgi:hypothetical protein